MSEHMLLMDSESTGGKSKTSARGAGVDIVFEYMLQASWFGKTYGRSKATHNQMAASMIPERRAYLRLNAAGSETELLMVGADICEYASNNDWER